jgi:molybdenum cofactor cytidylyltransferase
MIRGMLLAAGEGARFGGNKLLAVSDQGVPLAAASLRVLKAAGLEVTAMVRPGDTRLACLLEQEGARVLAPTEAGRGMGHSLAQGVAVSARAQGWIIALADMPFIQPATVIALLDALHQGRSLVAPVYAGRRGHPVGFARRYCQELLRLSGDQGARSVLQRHAEDLCLIPVDDPGVLLDIDHPEDLRLFQRPQAGAPQRAQCKT